MSDAATENGHLPITAAAAYPGFRHPEPVQLPSGAVFLLRKPQLMKMIRHGQIPNPLMQIVNEALGLRDQLDLVAAAEAKGMTIEEFTVWQAEQNESDTPPPPEMPLGDEQIVEATFAFTDVLVWAATLQPELELAPPVDGPLTESGKLSLLALSEADTQFIVNWCNEETAQAEQFPATDVGRQGADGDGGEVRAEAERPVGDPA